VKIRSLAEEARIIRHEERKAGGTGPLYEDLREHRVKDVRKEQRSTLIAYAFLRGRPYCSVERPASNNPPDWVRVRKIVQKFKDRPLVNLDPSVLKSWSESSPVLA